MPRRRRDRPTEDEYPEWMLIENRCDLFGDIERNHYQVAALQMRTQFEQSPVWLGLTAGYRTWDDEYYAEKGDRLFARDAPPELCIKPFKSIVNKSYRWNVVDNPNWPNQPDGGWVEPENWLARFNDVVRTSLTVRFLDGVGHVADRLHELCETEKAEKHSRFQARDDGYYAHHFSIGASFSVLAKNWQRESFTSFVEVQITTQMKEVLRGLLHRVYDRRRTQGGLPEGWEWDYRGIEFGTNYLGHVLHYIEGMIMTVREQEV